MNHFKGKCIDNRKKNEQKGHASTKKKILEVKIGDDAVVQAKVCFEAAKMRFAHRGRP